MRDIDVRMALRSELESRYGSDPETLILDELGVLQGRSRIDLAVVNGRLDGFEIKSESDTLGRLRAQGADYSRVFDRVTLVAPAGHLEAAAAGMVPNWWGLSQVEMYEGRVVLTCRREARQNPHIDAIALAQLLWRDEVLAILEDLGRAKGLRSKARGRLWQELVRSVAIPDLCILVRQALRTRASWRAG